MRKKIEIQDDPRVEDYFWKMGSDLRDEIKNPSSWHGLPSGLKWPKRRKMKWVVEI